MSSAQLALWVLARADRFGTREALVGDLLEEIGRGQSRLWLWRQLAGIYWFALAARARAHARVTPFAVALSAAVVLLWGVSVAPLGTVLETWMTFYLVAGTISLFAHVMARTAGGRTLVIAADGEPDHR